MKLVSFVTASGTAYGVVKNGGVVDLRRRLGERLQTLCSPAKPELASELALHFEEGREFDQSSRYLILAAGNAARRFAHRESIQLDRKSGV